MSNINERVKEIRLALKYNQGELGKAIGLSTSGISNIENGSRSVTDKHVKLLCHELNVNEEWLRHGTGEMFNDEDTSILDALSNEYNLDDLDQKIIRAYLKLGEFEKKVLKEFIKNTFEESKASSKIINYPTREDNLLDIAESEAEYKTTSKPKKISNKSIDEEVERYRRELEAEQKGATSQASEKPKKDAK